MLTGRPSPSGRGCPEGAGEGQSRESSLSNPHPALRATLSQRERDSPERRTYFRTSVGASVKVERFHRTMRDHTMDQCSFQVDTLLERVSKISGNNRAVSPSNVTVRPRTTLVVQSV